MADDNEHWNEALDNEVDMTKTISRFEYAIDSYINENIKSVDMDAVKCKSKEEETQDRKSNIEKKINRIKIVNTKGE